MERHNVTVVGAGPAGIAAAIQLQRYGVDPVLIEKDAVGGLLRSANLVENYPGFPNGISGSRLVELLWKHLDTAGVEVIYETVLTLDYHNDVFHLTTDCGKFSSRIVMIATGTRPIHPPLQMPYGAFGRCIFNEVVPLSSVQKKRIAIIGAGDAAFDYALNLAQYNQVLINNRSTGISCLPILWERAKTNINISYREDCILEQVLMNHEGLELYWKQGDRHWKENGDYLLFAIGRAPNLDFLRETLLDQFDSLEAEGVLYRIGDVKNGIYRQAGISVGDGLKAAMKVGRKIMDCVPLGVLA